jgi:uncharacterized protein YqeY
MILERMRAIKSMILFAQTEKGASESLTPDTEMKILQKATKQRQEYQPCMSSTKKR